MGWLDPRHIDSYFVQEKKYRGIAVIAREEVVAIFYSYFFKAVFDNSKFVKKKIGLLTTRQLIGGLGIKKGPG